MNFALSLCFYGILFRLLFSLVNDPEEEPDTESSGIRLSLLGLLALQHDLELGI